MAWDVAGQVQPGRSLSQMLWATVPEALACGWDSPCRRDSGDAGHPQAPHQPQSQLLEDWGQLWARDAGTEQLAHRVGSRVPAGCPLQAAVGDLRERTSDGSQRQPLPTVTPQALDGWPPC